MGNYICNCCKKIKNNKKIKQSIEESLDGIKKEIDQVGQDTYDILLTELGNNIRFLAVYDGHGIKGREAAQYAKIEIQKNLKKDIETIKKLEDRKEVEKYFHKLYNKIQSKFRQNQLDYESSGSCSISVLIINNNCYIINLGDSRAVIGSMQENKKIAYQMSIDHKPNRTCEKERIEKNGGYVSSDTPYGPYRIYSKNDDGPGLAVSRTFGDLFGHTVGVSNIPEVSHKKLNDYDSFVVIASDGVWDVMNSSEVVGFIFEKSMQKNPWSRQKIIDELVRECRGRWEKIIHYKEKFFTENKNEELNSLIKDDDNNNYGHSNKFKDLKKNVDDITAVVCFFTIILNDK